MPQNRVSSRLIRSERRKLGRQIIWYAGLAFMLIAIFLFVILPLFIRFINSVLDTNPITEETPDLVLQAPLIAAPVSATNSAQLPIEGVASPEFSVLVLLNGQVQESAETQADPDGAFSSVLTLTEGENTIALYARDSDGNETQTSREHRVLLDTQAPELVVESPQPDQRFSSKNPVEIIGISDPDSTIYVDGRVTFPREDGSFRYTYRLGEGEHTLSIRSVDKAGNETLSEIPIVIER